MKPITAHSPEGRVLLALRAGPMSNMALNERLGSTSAVYLLIKQGMVRRVGDEDGEFGLTEAGRAACPYRNPLAAPGAVKPAPKVPTMPRVSIITRNDVLNAILSAGAHGITRAALAEQFDRVGEEGPIDMHLTKLLREKPCLIARPRPGFVIAASHAQALLPETVFDKAMEARPEQCAPAVETITATIPGNRRGPIVFEDIDSEFALYSSGRVEICDGTNTVIIRGAALAKLSDFLQVFS
jgi:hypothetical protein